MNLCFICVHLLRTYAFPRTCQDDPKILCRFYPIFVAIDPIGLVAIFMGLATNASHEQQRRQGFIGISPRFI